MRFIVILNYEMAYSKLSNIQIEYLRQMACHERRPNQANRLSERQYAVITGRERILGMMKKEKNRDRQGIYLHIAGTISNSATFSPALPLCYYALRQDATLNAGPPLPAGYIVPANLQIGVKPQNEKVSEKFGGMKMGIAKQASQQEIFTNWLKVFVIFG